MSSACCCGTCCAASSGRWPNPQHCQSQSATTCLLCCILETLIVLAQLNNLQDRALTLTVCWDSSDITLAGPWVSCRTRAAGAGLPNMPMLLRTCFTSLATFCLSSGHNSFSVQVENACCSSNKICCKEAIHACSVHSPRQQQQLLPLHCEACRAPVVSSPAAASCCWNSVPSLHTGR